MVRKGVLLRDAANASLTPTGSGVYILYLNSQIMKVGSAKIGIQKRMQQYYGLNGYCGLNCRINTVNRDKITVSYQLCSASQCEELESKLFDKYGSPGALPWAQRRPHSSADTCTLYI